MLLPKPYQKMLVVGLLASIAVVLQISILLILFPIEIHNEVYCIDDNIFGRHACRQNAEYTSNTQNGIKLVRPSEDELFRDFAVKILPIVSSPDLRLHLIKRLGENEAHFRNEIKRTVYLFENEKTIGMPAYGCAVNGPKIDSKTGLTIGYLHLYANVDSPEIYHVLARQMAMNWYAERNMYAVGSQYCRSTNPVNTHP